MFLVDDDDSVREAAGRLLRSAGHVVELFGSADQLLARELPEGVPSCAVLDVNLPGLSGLELQTRLVERNERMPILFITGHADVPTTVRAMKAGAVEFLTKPFDEDELLEGVERALARSRDGLADRSEQRELQARWQSLSPRQREVMLHVTAGLLNKQIAAELGTAEITVKAQRRQVMDKMQAETLPDLVRMADRLGLSR